MLPSRDCSAFRVCSQAAALASAFCAASCCLNSSAFKLCREQTLSQMLMRFSYYPVRKQDCCLQE